MKRLYPIIILNLICLQSFSQSNLRAKCKGNELVIIFRNNEDSTIWVPRLFDRTQSNEKYKVLENRFYSVSNDTLRINLSRALPDSLSSGVFLSSGKEGLRVRIRYNDILLRRGKRSKQIVTLSDKIQVTKLKYLLIRYDRRNFESIIGHK